MPVMEGKSLLFKYLGGVDAVAICLDTKDPDKIIEAVRLLAPSFGGINLEDISQPKCFYVLDELRKDCKIPVWHDDQQGTAAVNLAGLFSGLKLTGKKIDEVKEMCIRDRVYFQAAPGCAVSLAEGIEKIDGVYFLEHGVPEALWILRARKFGPLVVGMDSHGKSIYAEIRKSADARNKELYG